ncbi:H-type small acid-soluble spore protein [Clostridium sp. 19966]|uniref:H-type small acid-soluble spore protein n=1 Tax=Clostridium sp. 19966 TaxID=2768166 RepID=UPI0028DEC6BF|nr:H-type small acid-soluble spore protein [Clostridium sp. 19966]MDT8717912.1 H-type small acid-soluble spore protein [Clostridium sp. 19966]
MDKDRACQIFESEGVIDVVYNGSSIWIEEISEGQNCARVKDLSTKKELTVKLSELKEG